MDPTAHVVQHRASTTRRCKISGCGVGPLPVQMSKALHLCCKKGNDFSEISERFIVSKAVDVRDHEASSERRFVARRHQRSSSGSLSCEGTSQNSKLRRAEDRGEMISFLLEQGADIVSGLNQVNQRSFYSVFLLSWPLMTGRRAQPAHRL